MPRILITGPTGNVGLPLLRALHGHPGVELLAAVRDPARAAQALQPFPLAQPVPFDFTSPATYAPALAQCDRLFLLRPPQVASALGPLIQAAKRAGVQHIVFLSVQGTERNPLLPHRRTEKLLEKSGIPYTFLRPAYFMQNFLGPLHADLVERRRIFLPAGRARFTLIDTRDIARAAARILLDPAPHAGRAYALTAQSKLTFPQMAAELSASLETPIRYISPTPWRFYRAKRREELPRPFILVMLLLHFLPRFTPEPPVTGDVRLLTGQPPAEFPAFIAHHRAALESRRPQVATPS